MSPSKTALLQLLDDEESETVALVRAELVAHGAPRIEEYRALLPHAAGAAARHLREIIGELESRHADEIFGRMCAQFGEAGDIERAAWQLASVFLPRERLPEQRATLDRWGAEVRRRLQKVERTVDRVETLVEFLADEVRLRGDREDYYNVNHSLLPEVIDSRRGIPITLSLVYMLVGRRAGLPVDGVALPGHFVIRCGEHFFDPFDSGRRLGVEQCRDLVMRCGVMLRPEHLHPASPRQILMRMLGNLFAISRESDPALAAKLGGWIEALGADEA